MTVPIMTQADLYDWLLTQGVREPAVVKLGDRCVAGRWESIGERLANGMICRSGRVGIRVLGEGSSWDEAHRWASARLAGEKAVARVVARLEGDKAPPGALDASGQPFKAPTTEDASPTSPRP